MVEEDSFSDHKLIYCRVVTSVERKVYSKVKDIFNVSLRLGLLPNLGKQVKVIFIPEVDKMGYSTAKDYIELLAVRLSCLRQWKGLWTFKLGILLIRIFYSDQITETSLHVVVGCL